MATNVAGSVGLTSKSQLSITRVAALDTQRLFPSIALRSLVAEIHRFVDSLLSAFDSREECVC